MACYQRLLMTRLADQIYLTTRQLEVFVKVAEKCSFADAAEQLDISQSAVSNHIASLEKQLNCELFARRRGSSPTLSFNGARYLAEVSRFLQATDDIADTAATHRQTTLRGYAGNHILDCFLKPLLRQFHEDHPDIALSFTTEMPGKGLAANLESGSLDFAFFPSASETPPEKARVLANLTSGIFARRDLPAPRRERLGLILPHDGSIDAMALAIQMSSTEFASRPVEYHSQYAAVTVELAAAGKGLAPLLQTMVTMSDAGSQLEMVHALPDWQLCLQTAPGLPPSHQTALERFAEAVTREVETLQARTA